MRYVFSILFVFVAAFGVAQENRFGKVYLCDQNNGNVNCFIRDNTIYEYGLDTTAQVQFWRSIINMSPDSGIMNHASTRKSLMCISSKEYNRMSTNQKDSLRNELRYCNNLSDSSRILFSHGRNDFYNVKRAMQTIDKGICAFEQENTDPFYAQAILLIESPGMCAKSNVGAYGSFQLMKPVARQLGLKVNKHVDERSDFNKSAWAAAKLIRTICIPYTNKILDARGITYNQTDLWYRLLVLHVYHAGAGNVAKAINVIDPCEGNIELIKSLWQTKAGQFGIASQNYSQVALANLIELDLLLKQMELVYNKL